MIHFIVRIFQFVALVGCLSSSIYYLICLWSVRLFLRGRKAGRSVSLTQGRPPVSILKPLKGTDPDIYECFRSHCLQDYPEYEIIFGVSDPDDPAVASVQQLQGEFPDHAIRLVVCPNNLGANVKVSNLEQMLSAARYEQLLVNDSDIRVENDYLRRVIAPLADARVGMVTCLYRGVAASTVGSQLESVGISTDFCAGVLVARQLEGGLRFGLGSTLAFRRADLERIGGFRSIVDFLADDYELGRRIAGLGLQVVLSDAVVETHLPAYDLRGFLAHQLRWARGVRDSRAGGYLGLVSTYGLMWALLVLIAARAAPWSLAVVGTTVLLRLAVALAVGKVVLADQPMLRHLWLLPVRDLVAAAVWVASFAGHTVTWRGDRFELKNGRLIRIAP
ncbi:MAG: bacteriohopanetetrol glucosamine biosynthesis glycosyltransferase HpnI [Candidatus Sulfotelmatobacter sp.]